MLDNIDANDWIKFNFQRPEVYVNYSKQVLDEWFPASGFASMEERFQVISETLERKIVPVKLDNLVEVVRTLMDLYEDP